MKNYLLLFLTFIAVNAFSQWPNDPEENIQIYETSGDEALPKTASDTEGNTYIAFHSSGSGNYDVLMAYLDKDGNFLWDEPLLISDHEQQSWISDFSMNIDPSGNAVVSFSDTRTGNPDIHAYKVSPEGEFLWGDNGIACSQTPEPEYEPKLAINDNNIAFITYIHPRETASDQLVVTAVDHDGNLLFGEEGLVFTSDSDDVSYSDPFMTAAGENVIVVYSLTSGSFPAATRHLYAMMLNADGEEVWDEPALISDAGGIAGFTELSVKSDNDNGVIIAWHDDRNNDMISTAYVQHVDSEGIATLTTNGVELGTGTGVQRFDPIAVRDIQKNEIYAFWRQTDANQNESGLFGQRISADGERLWGNNGLELLALGTTFDALHDLKLRNDGEMIVFYSKTGETSESFLHAMALNQEGESVWPQSVSTISAYPSGISNVTVSDKHQEQYVLSWQDSRGDQGIYAQNMHHDGNIGIIDNQISVTEPESFSVYPNPAVSAATINTKKAGTVTISNSQGKILLKQNAKQAETINFEPGTSGLYFVTFIDGSQTETRKLIIR